MSPTEARRQLEGVRLDQGWSWDQLAADVERVTHRRLSPMTLHRFVEKRAKTFKTTMHVLVTYLDAKKLAAAEAPAGSR